MEKRKPSHDLERFKAVCGLTSTLRITLTAQISAQRLGYDLEGVAQIIRSMSRRMFYKSMTSFSDHTAWQDVYHVPAGDRTIYLKFVDDIVSEFLVLSFKERD
ncbi:MAG TPA: type II toxin-antitoxin system MqsR family toxin [Bauldia sp.]|nr:type II toxin-antitoxin system MqsR family toxin [Bauldia sp.]